MSPQHRNQVGAINQRKRLIFREVVRIGPKPLVVTKIRDWPPRSQLCRTDHARQLRPPFECSVSPAARICRPAEDRIIDFSRTDLSDLSAYIAIELNKRWKKKLDRWTKQQPSRPPQPMIVPGPVLPHFGDPEV